MCMITLYASKIVSCILINYKKFNDKKFKMHFLSDFLSNFNVDLCSEMHFFDGSILKSTYVLKCIF